MLLSQSVNPVPLAVPVMLLNKLKPVVGLTWNKPAVPAPKVPNADRPEPSAVLVTVVGTFALENRLANVVRLVNGNSSLFCELVCLAVPIVDKALRRSRASF